MVNSNFIRRSLLRKHHLVRERDYELDCRRVDLAERLGYRIVLISRYSVIHEELKDERVMDAFGHQTDLKSISVISLPIIFHQLIVLMSLSIEPQIAEAPWLLFGSQIFVK